MIIRASQKIVFSLCIFLLSVSFAFASNLDSKVIDKDNLNNLINNVSSLRAGSDRVEFVYDFSRNFENSPYKIALSLLDLSRLGGNLNLDGITRDEYVSFAPKNFIGFSFYNYAIGYQMNLVRKTADDEGDFNDIAQSHSLSFAMNYRDSFYFNVPMSYAFGNGTFKGNMAFSLTPRFGWKFRAGLLNHFAFSVHYGMSFPHSTNDVKKVNPVSIGFSLFGDIAISRLSDSPIGVSIPIQIDFRYGVKSRDAYIDATYAYNLYDNLMYDENGEQSTDTIYLNVLVPLKLESKLGMVYTSLSPKLAYLLRAYKSNFAMSLNYMVEGELSVTAVENLTFGLTANLKGTFIDKNGSYLGIENGYNFGGFGGGVDVWGIWRF